MLETGSARQGSEDRKPQATPAVVSEPAAPVEESVVSAWPDESGESAFLAEAREQGEPLAAAKPQEQTDDPADAGALPALKDLVQRIPADVRAALDDLFRAKFVAVKRVPQKALKELSP